ncbi:MAG: hypothetical protein IT378_07830 [Sandaracinaceae bacterium]|nr:hypothetical protein [Sandaracinaceae bacterium]
MDERDPESVARFFAAVAPIDQFRITRTNGEVTEEDEPVVEEPTEPAEPTPTS